MGCSVGEKVEGLTKSSSVFWCPTCLCPQLAFFGGLLLYHADLWPGGVSCERLPQLLKSILLPPVPGFPPSRHQLSRKPAAWQREQHSAKGLPEVKPPTKKHNTSTNKGMDEVKLSPSLPEKDLLTPFRSFWHYTNLPPFVVVVVVVVVVVGGGGVVVVVVVGVFVAVAVVVLLWCILI